MLLGHFFDISQLEKTEFDIKAELIIHADHLIFDGHFPGRPVVPGVCMMQMVKEIIEAVTGRKTNLLKAQEMKFLAVIDPMKHNSVHVILKYIMEENGNMNVSATFNKGEIIYFKFKGLLQFQEPHF